jgi:hypothetical protein
MIANANKKSTKTMYWQHPVVADNKRQAVKGQFT